MARPRIDFSRSRRVPLEAPKGPVARPAKKAVRGVEKAPAVAEVKAKKEKVKTPVVSARALSGTRMSQALTSILERATTGEFRGRKEKPALMFTQGEMAALQQCLANFTPVLEPPVPVASSEKAGKGKKSRKVA